MAQAIENKGRLPAEISSRLGALRRKINFWLIINGLSRLLLAAVVLLAFDFAIDRFFEMDLSQRLILVVLIGLALLVIFFWGLIRPFTGTTRDDALVLQVEQKHKGLKESLISAVQFSRDKSVEKQGVSQAMIDETIRHGTEQAKSVPFGSILDQQKLLMNLVLLLISAAALAFGAYKISQTGSDLAIWFNRNIMMGDREYPKETYLYFPEIEGDTVVIARGENFPLLVAIDMERSKKTDVEVVLDYVDAGGSNTQSMRRKTTRSEESGDKSAVDVEEPAKNAETSSKAMKVEKKDSTTEPPSKDATTKDKADIADDQKRVGEKSVDNPNNGDEETKPDADAKEVSDEESSGKDEGDEKAGEKSNKQGNEDAEQLQNERPDDNADARTRRLTLTPVSYIENVGVNESGKSSADPPKKTLDNEHVFERVFQNVNSEFKFRARGGDGVTRWIQVKLVEPPAATDLKIRVTSPEYTQSPVETVEGSGPHSFLKGSSISLTARANKPLGRAVLENPAGEEIELLGNDSAADDLHLSASISADKLIAGKYRFILEDTNGLTTSKPASFDIRIRADRPPIVRASLKGVSGLVVPRAIVPISAKIRDDFAITGGKIIFNWKGDTGDSVAKSGEQEFQSVTEEEYGQRELVIDGQREEWDLEPLGIPERAALRFVVSAIDNDTISGPNQGDSTEFLLRIVSEEELRTDLLRRETEQRQEFERLLKEQRDLLLESESMAADSVDDIKDVERYYSEKRKDLIAFKRRQKLMGTNVANVADRFQEFLIEALNNRLEDSKGSVRRRLQDGIIDPMRALSVTTDNRLSNVDGTVIELEQTRRVVQDDENWQPAIDAVVVQQQTIVEEMEKILLQMAKQESFQEAVNLLRAIEKAEGELMNRVKKEKADRLKNIFESGNTDSGDGKDGEKDSENSTEDTEKSGENAASDSDDVDKNE